MIQKTQDINYSWTELCMQAKAFVVSPPFLVPKSKGTIIQIQRKNGDDRIIESTCKRARQIFKIYALRTWGGGRVSCEEVRVAWTYIYYQR